MEDTKKADAVVVAENKLKKKIPEPAVETAKKEEEEAATEEKYDSNSEIEFSLIPGENEDEEPFVYIMDKNKPTVFLTDIIIEMSRTTDLPCDRDSDSSKEDNNQSDDDDDDEPDSEPELELESERPDEDLNLDDID